MSSQILPDLTAPGGGSAPLTPATRSALGGVIIGQGLDVAVDGIIMAGATVTVICPQLADSTTVTMTKGGDVKSETVSGGKVIFDGVPFGTWVLSSGTFSRNVVIDEVKVYNIPLVRVYAYQIAKTDSNPATRVTYPKTVQIDGVTYPVENFNYRPLRNIDGAGITYGDWTGDEFFFPRPCMVLYDGTIDYYLDPANYAYAIDGTASDVANLAYGGNAMVQFPRAWVCRREDTVGSVTFDTFILAEAKLSNDFYAFAHKDSVDGTLRDNMFQGIYACCTDSSNRMRSISGQTITAALAGAIANADLYAEGVTNSMIGRAIANNTAGSIAPGRWFSRTWAQWAYMQDLIILLTRSTDGQGTIARGNSGSGSTGTAITTSGRTNAYGLFGGPTNSNATQMKALGIEDLWANHWKWTIGRSLVSNKNVIKMCVDGEDGSTAGVYNFAGTGGVNTNQGQLGTNGWNYPGAYSFSKLGRYGTAQGGSTSTYCCDGIYCDTSLTASTALAGGDYTAGLPDGPAGCALNYALSGANARLAFALSLV